MANKNFHFPASGQTMKAPNGDEYYFKIYYEDTTEQNIDTGLEFDLDRFTLPIEAKNQTFRFTSLEILILNDYTGGNDIDSLGVINSAKEKQTFIDVYRNGSLFWRGFVDHKAVNKQDYYIESGQIRYRELRIKADDIIKHLWVNGFNLSDASYSDEIKLETFLQQIFALSGIQASEINLDANIAAFSENCGNSYNITDLYIAGFGANMLISNFLLSLIKGLAVNIYYLNGKLNIVSKAASPGTITVDNDDVDEEISVEANPEYPNYLEVGASKDWSAIANDLANNTETYLHTAGTKDTGTNYIIDGNDFLDRIYTKIDGSEYFGSFTTTYAEEGDYDYLLDEDENFYAEEIETGMVLEFQISGSGKSSIIENVTYQNETGSQVDILQANDAIDLDTPYRIHRQVRLGSWTDQRIYKIKKITEKVFNDYNKALRTGKELLRITLLGLDTYLNPTNTFNFLGKNWKVKSATIHIKKDKITYKLYQI